jgi:hypothetical protein
VTSPSNFNEDGNDARYSRNEENEEDLQEN